MKQIPLTKGKFALVDDEDFERISRWKWYCCSRGYAARSIREGKKVRMIRMHRILNNTNSELHTDHIDGDRLNNQKDNLRSCTHAENMRHRKNLATTKGLSYNGNILI